MNRLKAYLRKMARLIVGKDSLNRVFEKTIGWLTDCLRLERELLHQSQVGAAFEAFAAGHVVVGGPFAGMRYPMLKSVGSALYPKILGTYESELHETVYHVLRNEYDQIIDVGCAEGYYAVGFGILKPTTPVIAFDTSAVARELCAGMVHCNCADRQDIEIHGFSSPEELSLLCQKKRCLLISDCEGYEEQLFVEQYQDCYRFTDLLIEIHQPIGSAVDLTIEKCFRSTHTVSRISAWAKEQKAIRFRESLNDCMLSDRIICSLVDEGRPPGMFWIIALANNPGTCNS